MKRQGGFTLIEMLIAMTLLSVMVVLLFGSLNIAAESWNAGEAKIAQVNKKAVVYQFFKRHLTTIRPVLEEPDPKDAGADASLVEQVFQGQSQSMRFVAALPAASTRKGLQLFEIAADRAEPSTIMVTLRPYQQSEPGEPEPVVLLEHVNRFAFAYFGVKEEGGKASWQEDWAGVDRLPSLIKVGIELDDGSYWPDMVFPLKINGQIVADAIPPEGEQLGDQAGEP